MPKKQKLELTWIGKDQRPKLEPRILIEDPDKSYHAPQRVSENDIFDNMLIHGDNLLALKALEQEYAGKVKCVYIDPPYNTGSAFEHYDDGLEHSQWLSLMKWRLEILWRLLDKDHGSIWISIDDYELHYLKILCDEIFGRSSFLTTIIWQQRTSRENRRVFSNNHEYILVYAKSPKDFTTHRNDLGLNDEVRSRYKNPDDDPRGPWQSVSANAQAGHATPSQFYTLEAPNGKRHDPPNGRCWVYTERRMKELIADNRIWFGRDGNGAPRVKKYLSEVTAGLTPQTFWSANEVGTNDHAKKYLLSLFKDAPPFDTPKPETLIERIVHIATNPGDIVLDSFLGSGTTATVAHKMGRHWIGVELGEHCETHCQPRLQKVVDGEDPGGITESANWQGGGGFRYYELGPSLIEQDKWGNPIISKEFDPPKLTQAMCKLEGFDYAPDPDTYWMQGRSSETDFIYVTSQTMSKDMLTKLSDEVGDNRSLLVCCPSFRAKEGDFTNLTLKKIPKAVLKKCEWGRDDYSLQIQELPPAPPPEDGEDDAKRKKPRRKFGKGNPNQGELFS